ncbi:hypothetical protein PIB30_043784 [Stylosanthes scabra]|uniref:Uncharacterized protein n=1 Tax=Stylosanthes scabra TaxID=79078 RepID=A0ABU6RG95_9FABA|nr:hypothetical protein [Stylosanthes scabra]
MSQTKIILALILVALMVILCEWFHYYYSSIERTSSVDSAKDDEDNTWCIPPPLEQQMPPWQLAVKLPCRHLRGAVSMDFGQHTVVIAMVFQIPFTINACACLSWIYTY